MDTHQDLGDGRCLYVHLRLGRASLGSTKTSVLHLHVYMFFRFCVQGTAEFTLLTSKVTVRLHHVYLLTAPCDRITGTTVLRHQHHHPIHHSLNV